MDTETHPPHAVSPISWGVPASPQPQLPVMKCGAIGVFEISRGQQTGLTLRHLQPQCLRY